MKTLIGYDEDDGGEDEPPDSNDGGSEEPLVPPVGQKVIVIDGPFADFEGIVDNINQEKGKVRVRVSFFGRDTPVELDFGQVRMVEVDPKNDN